ncbi:MAG: 30S ribosomal protein S18 [uncultured bacterium]|nr:MAG: 30S ribosomal protein S18 [uncultured bacterium]HLE76266.1 30S ribosomal protein S18 [Candidatus Babeliales bacterium]
MTKKIKLKISARLVKKRTRRASAGGAKQCRFCGTPEQVSAIDYKNAGFLRAFLTERGKILPSRISGNCSLHQRSLSREVRKSRTMALLPYIAQYN